MISQGLTLGLLRQKYIDNFYYFLNFYLEKSKLASVKTIKYDKYKIS